MTFAKYFNQLFSRAFVDGYISFNKSGILVDYDNIRRITAY